MASENSSFAHNSHTSPKCLPIKGLQLFKFLDGQETPPKYLNHDETLHNIINPTYLQYEQQDQLLIIWLLKSMDTFIQLCTPKNERTDATYLLDIKKIVDTLAAIESTLTTEDHIEAILYGLSEDYESIFTSILTRTDPYTIEEIEALLLPQEERLEKYKIRNNRSTNRNNSSFKNQQSTTKRTLQETLGNSKNQCEICNKFGHTTTTCWLKFEYDFQPSISANQSQLCSSEIQDDTPSILGMPSILSDPLWCPNSGATHHITPDS
ncbi:hypothetical protein V8G54_013918 [Vigna mungo]|uniref:Uncharacterized protein n=1 Tax=Vigna mungo TaxID=3915 RepID=A0AAQ3NIH3_VIGMU